MSIEQYQQPQGVALSNGWSPPVPVQQTQLQKLAEWTQAADAAYTVSQKLVVTAFVPAQYRNKPAEATAAILAGMELGLSPMASLKAFDDIQGTAAPKAITIRAVVQGAGHEIWLHESNSERAIVKGRRRGSDQVQVSTWTMDRARRLGLTGKKQWKEQQEAMLIARAYSECGRLTASDALLGMPYSSEELMDGVDAPVQAVAERTVQRRTPSARKAAANTRPAAAPAPVSDEPPLDEPPLDDEQTGPFPDGEPPFEVDDVTDTEMITKPQLTKLAICLKEGGLTDRERGLTFMSMITGRKVSSSKELTKAEASGVIDNLDHLTNEQIAAMVDGNDDEPDQLPLGGNP